MFYFQLRFAFRPRDQISFSIDAFLVRGPIKFLIDELKEKRFLEGVVVSVTYFERFGLEKLSDYFKSKGIPVEPPKP